MSFEGQPADQLKRSFDEWNMKSFFTSSTDQLLAEATTSAEPYDLAIIDGGLPNINLTDVAILIEERLKGTLPTVLYNTALSANSEANQYELHYNAVIPRYGGQVKLFNGMVQALGQKESFQEKKNHLAVPCMFLNLIRIWPPEYR